jgi:hypothetical protein
VHLQAIVAQEVDRHLPRHNYATPASQVQAPLQVEDFYLHTHRHAIFGDLDVAGLDLHALTTGPIKLDLDATSRVVSCCDGASSPI